MDKDIRQYLKYYIGQQCIITAPDGIDYHYPDTLNMYWVDRVEKDGGRIRPTLRKLESMTEEEMKDLAELRSIKKQHFKSGKVDQQGVEIEYFNIGRRVNEVVGIYFKSMSASQFHYLLSLGIDLFGLIDAGLAIDKATIKS